MPLAPGRHLAQRLEGRPGALVGTVGRDCIVDVTDRAHLGESGDFVAFQPIGVAAAVDAFVMVQADIECDLVELAAAGEQLVAVARMVAHRRELVLGEAPGFVKDLVRYADLADVVKQSGGGGLMLLGFTHAERLGKLRHQCADCHRMQVGVFVGALDLHQAQKRAGVAIEALMDRAHRGIDSLGIQIAPELGIPEQRFDGVAHHSRDFASLVHLLGQRCKRLWFRCFRGLGDDVGDRLDRLDRRLRGGFGLNTRFSRSARIRPCARRHPARQVDHDRFQAAGLQPFNDFGRIDQERRPEKIVLQPGPAEAVDIHADAHLGGRHPDQLGLFGDLIHSCDSRLQTGSNRVAMRAPRLRIGPKGEPGNLVTLSNALGVIAVRSCPTSVHREADRVSQTNRSPMVAQQRCARCDIGRAWFAVRRDAAR